MTSVVVHAALIVLGVATATVIMAPPPQPFVEQSAPVDGDITKVSLTIPNLSTGNMPRINEVASQEVDPEAARGFASAAGKGLDVDAGGGSGPDGQAADLLMRGPGVFGTGNGIGLGKGNANGNSSGDGGPVPIFGSPKQGGGDGLFINPRQARRIVFVCDATGTMINKIGTLKHELTRAIAGLKPVQSFNIIFFTDGGKYHIASREGLFLATPDNKRQAYAFLEDISPTGTTDPTPAIEAAFKQLPDLVYFLSDGEFNNLKPYADVVRQFDVSNKQRKSRVNAILFETYDREAEQAMQRIAEDSGGTYRFVRETDLQ
ncbi:vWA domain-containing protein [Humisphaera borealis]|uniref:VWFA domain-containing protein n=1 Tax=Humisphaera borealis TaxID=2807512 RepID=A0A7M2WQV5_9BACT|nr:hypothetical protein [Humisphaera borealis]QOV87935.1 hypothetical protein IPV69_16880 [Humisphaera borealis]